MSNLTINNPTPMDATIKRETGERTFPIWLIINPKHPAVLHHIWTPILAEIQDKVYRETHTRMDTSNIYIRAAVGNCDLVPSKLNWWGTEIAQEIETFKEIVFEHQPKLLISFGAFPFEFLRRVYEIKPEKVPRYWGTSNLGDEFRASIENFKATKTNRIPLLRRVISSGKLIGDHDSFIENYFHYVGTKIAEKIIENKDRLKIWIE
ncbi:MAG: hypothetical protein P4L59_05525 [Desulfosporosinus sp.]|nr:hypothetical protein [Desulfosporosinus sp.]